MRKKNITLCIILFTLCSSISYSRGRQFFTARTRGSAGAGVASILLNDALYLNPASLAWFEKKLVGAQYSQSNEDLEGDLKGLNLSVIDTSTAYKGGFSYEQLEEFGLERDRYSASFAKKTSRLGSFGVTYRFTQDEFDGEDDDRHQLDLGYTRILTRNITIGGVVQNLFDLDQEEARTTIGLQYKVLTGVFLIGDVGANVDDISESNSLRGAIQLKIFKSTYIRAGLFQDKQEGLEGNSFGISWYPHRFQVDLSYLRSEFLESEFGQTINPGEDFDEISLSIAARF